MGYLKGKEFSDNFRSFRKLKYQFDNRKFWSVGYRVSTVGLNEATIRKYIREQDQRDLMLYAGKGNGTMSFLYSKAEKALKDVIFLYR